MFLRLLDEGLKRKVPDMERYRKRLDEEVYIIESTDNVDYFLVQWDMVREAHRGVLQPVSGVAPPADRWSPTCWVLPPSTR